MSEVSPVARIVLRLLVDGRLPSPIARFAHRRARTAPSWARAYHELRTAERALEGSPPLSSGQRAFLRARVLAASQGATRPVVAHAPVPWLAGAAAAASVAAFLVLAPGAPSPDAPSDTGDDTFAPRSAHTGTGGIRVHCVDAARSGVLDEADVVVPPAAPATLRCPVGGLLAFSATNRAAQPRWPAVVARIDGARIDGARIDGARTDGAGPGDVAFTVPFEGEESAAVPAGAVAVRLSRGAPLAEAGALLLRGALFDEAVAAGDVARLLDDDAPALRVEVTPQ